MRLPVHKMTLMFVILLEVRGVAPDDVSFVVCELFEQAEQVFKTSRWRS